MEGPSCGQAMTMLCIRRIRPSGSSHLQRGLPSISNLNLINISKAKPSRSFEIKDMIAKLIGPD